MKKETVILTALVVSVAVNLLVAGFLVGQLALKPRLPHGPGPAVMVSPEPGPAWRLPQRDRDKLDRKTVKALRQTFQHHNEVARPTRTSMREARRRVRELLAEDEFDADAMRQALGDLRTRTNEYQELRHGQMVDTMADLTPEERLRVYRFLSGPDRGKGRDKGRGSDRGRDKGEGRSPDQD